MGDVGWGKARCMQLDATIVTGTPIFVATCETHRVWIAAYTTCCVVECVRPIFTTPLTRLMIVNIGYTYALYFRGRKRAKRYTHNFIRDTTHVFKQTPINSEITDNSFRCYKTHHILFEVNMFVTCITPLLVKLPVQRSSSFCIPCFCIYYRLQLMAENTNHINIPR
jgi:hypothetical protein